MPRCPGREQFNKVMFAQFVAQMDGQRHARVWRLLLPAFSSRWIEQLEESITRIVAGMLDRTSPPCQRK
jgi:cytochrome P450